ncbi:hypothetical protein BG261_02855 [Floricoccus tropicus]|uniref:Uncharacterized protein n=1 Tax=Floricoccus tropicus TaxID=1859473 RepID=A0A1E8GMR1_9LACT|nr:hypothetical protein [Floricoccus tropicus]OFI49535.1 hypothetical protein BG261_02855 [Floricoccus tropicus]
MKVELTRSQYDAYEEELKSYKDIDRKIKRRREEISTNAEQDERVGSPSGIISRQPESLAIKYSEDRELCSYYNFKKNVDELQETLPQIHRDIFELRWLNDYEWTDMIKSCNLPKVSLYNLSKASIYNKRKYILNAYARISGRL